MILLDFSGINLNEDLKLNISGALNNLQPFALKSKRGSFALFIPESLTAIYLYRGKKLTVQKCAGQQEFLAAIGLAVLSHREFTVVPGKMLKDAEKLLN